MPLSTLNIFHKWLISKVVIKDNGHNDILAILHTKLYYIKLTEIIL
jgi:hypothetical protein